MPGGLSNVSLYPFFFCCSAQLTGSQLPNSGTEPAQPRAKPGVLGRQGAPNAFSPLVSFPPLLCVQPVEGEPETHSTLVVCPKRAAQRGLHRGPAGRAWHPSPEAGSQQAARGAGRRGHHVLAGVLSGLSQLDRQPSQTGLGAGEARRLRGFEEQDEFPATTACCRLPALGPGAVSTRERLGLGSQGGTVSEESEKPSRREPAVAGPLTLHTSSAHPALGEVLSAAEGQRARQGDFPGGPAVRAWSSQGGGARVTPGLPWSEN